jgi:hypothetical protein
MKFIAIIAVALFACVVSPAFAQQAGSSQPEGVAAAQAPAPQEVDKQVAAMQEQMKKMQQQMAKIQQTQDPQQRQKLLKEHWETMQGAMTMMNNAWGGMMGAGQSMMGGHMTMGGPMMWGNYQQLTPEQLKQRQYMMDQWMPMQQMMMGQMMMHQHWMMMQPPPPPPGKQGRPISESEARRGHEPRSTSDCWTQVGPAGLDFASPKCEPVPTPERPSDLSRKHRNTLIGSLLGVP